MRTELLGNIASIDLSNVDKKSKENEAEVVLCNFTDVYYKWAITKELIPTLMKATANKSQIERFSIHKGQVAITKDSETRDDIGVATYIADDIPNGVLGYHCALITPNEDILLGKYLNVVLHTSYAQRYFEANASGSGQRYTLTSDIIACFPVPLPDVETQNKIASVFNNIDKKIALNNSISADLEAMAKQLYDYWFVQFDFPDENGKPYKSSGGKMVWNEELKREIPEGWEVTSLGNKCQCLLGGTPSRKKPEYWNGNINWINSGTINEFRVSKCSEKITELGLKNTSTYLMPKNTVVLAITGATLGQVSILNIDACANQSVVGILENEQLPTEYIYPMVINSLKALLNNQTGAAQPHINKEDVKAISFAFPTKKIMKKYVSTIKETYSVIMNLCDENQTLTSLRDFLLPMLMNGQITIKKH